MDANLSNERTLNRLSRLGEDKPLYLSPGQDSPTMPTHASAAEARP